ncbi:hypothetical protein Tco_1139100, partial [Tanacetum coccineum]
ESEASKEEDDDDDEEEHLALADSSVVPIDDLVPSTEDTEAFETDESAPTPPPPRLRRARISKRLCLTVPAPRFKVGESSAAAARQPGLDVTYATDYSFVVTVDATPRHLMSREDAHETYVRFEDAHDDRAFLRAQINMICRDRHYFKAMATQLTAALRRIQTLEAREPVRTDNLEDADSSA